MNRYNNKIRVAIIAMLFLPLILALGCGGGGSNNYSTNPPPTNPTPPPPPPPGNSHVHNVSIQYMAFSPASLSIPAGDTVVWTNGDDVTHTVTSDTGGELSSGPIAAGATFRHVFGTRGPFAYHCSIHTYMHGSVTVQ